MCNKTVLRRTSNWYAHHLVGWAVVAESSGRVAWWHLLDRSDEDVGFIQVGVVC